jgi:hypothetical protein
LLISSLTDAWRSADLPGDVETEVADAVADVGGREADSLVDWMPKRFLRGTGGAADGVFGG